MPMTAAAEIIAHLRSLRNERNIAGMRRFGIVSEREQLGISVAVLREIGRPRAGSQATRCGSWGGKGNGIIAVFFRNGGGAISPAA